MIAATWPHCTPWHPRWNGPNNRTFRCTSSPEGCTDGCERMRTVSYYHTSYFLKNVQHKNDFHCEHSFIHKTDSIQFEKQNLHHSTTNCNFNFFIHHRIVICGEAKKIRLACKLRKHGKTNDGNSIMKIKIYAWCVRILLPRHDEHGAGKPNPEIRCAWMF